MKKWIVVAALLFAALLGYVAAGPFMTVRAISAAIKAQDTAALSEHVDFPTLRLSLKAQVSDYIARRAGPEAQSNAFGAIGIAIASGVAGTAVDAIATPAGIGLALESRNFLRRLGRERQRQDSYAQTTPADPLKGADYRFESPSRFTATVPNADGEPVVFVLTRRGLSWVLSDIRLPLGAPEADA